MAAALPIIKVVALAVGAAGTVYSGYRSKRTSDVQKSQAAAAERQRKEQEAAAARAAEEARKEAERLRLEQERIKAEAKAKEKAAAERKQKLIGVETKKKKVGQQSLMATGLDVWTTKPQIRKRSLLGAGDRGPQLKSLMGE